MSVEPASYITLTADSEIEHIADDVFAFTGVIRDPIFGVPHRMTVMRIPGTNDLVVYSPFDPALVDLSGLGTVKAIISPNRIHYNYAHRFKSAHPQATLYTSAALQDRFPDKDWGVILDDATAEDIISPHVLVKTITACAFLQEVMVLHVPSGTVLAADLAFNLTPELLSRAPFGGRMFYKFASSPKPLDIHSLVRSWVRPDCAQIKVQLQSVLNDWEWDRFVPCHGAVVEKGAKKAFRNGTFQFVSETAEEKAEESPRGKVLLFGAVGVFIAITMTVCVRGSFW